MRLISAVSGVQIPAPPPEIIEEFPKNTVPGLSLESFLSLHCQLKSVLGHLI